MLIIDRKKFLLACAEKCVSELEVTKRAGVSSCVLNRIKHERPVHTETLGKLARALGLSPVELIKE